MHFVYTGVMKSMLYRDDTRIHSRQAKGVETQYAEKPAHCDEFKACLVQALKILEERYEV